MSKGSKDRYGQADVMDEIGSEGIEAGSYKGPVSGIIHQLVGGLRSGMGYLEAETIEYAEETSFVKSILSLKESHVHDVAITKEAQLPYE